jgi:hypothetical protein
MVKRFAIEHTRQKLQGRGTYKFTNSLDQLGPKSGGHSRTNDGDRFGFSVALTPDASFVTIGANQR